MKETNTWIASPQTETISGAWRKTLPQLATASALLTKSEVLTAALSAGWNSTHQELRFATQSKKKKKKRVKEKEENKSDMRF